jgi:hypothetical protein
MRRDDNDLVARLAHADPASEVVLDDGFRARTWREVTARRALAASTPRRARWPRRRLLTPVLPVALVLAGGAAAAATGVIRIGAPATPFPFGDQAPVALHRLVAVAPRAVRLLSVASSDPQGGPQWGLRIVRTVGGYGCIEVGRVLDGKFGGVGEDGSFHNDGEFHEVPAGDAEDAAACTTLDRNGRIFYNVASAVGIASGTFFVPGGCVSARAFALPLLRLLQRHSAQSDLCPASSDRTLIYGLLGPDATSITYTLNGHSHVQATVGPEGAYLLVGNGSSAADPQLANAPVATGVLPVRSPITAISYRGGITCRLRDPRHDGYSRSCLPHGHPVGYVVQTPAAKGKRK